MKYKILLYKILILLLYSTTINAYQEDKKLKDKREYKALRDNYYKHRDNDSLALANKTIQQYILKAKQNNDSLRLADGFYLLSTIIERDSAQKYCDSVISLTQNYNISHYPLLAYRKKATMYYYEYNFKKAFDYFLKVTEEAKKHNNELYYYKSIRDMVLLKAHVGEHETGLVTLRKCFAYFSKIKDKAPEDYYTTMFALSDSYMRNKKLDSATIINHLGYQHSTTSKNDIDWRHHFTLNEGINQYYKTNFTVAKDSLEKAINAISETKNPVTLANIGMAYFYLGKTLSALDAPDEALDAHKKVDKIFQDAKVTIPEIRYSYDILINHYKDLGDKDNHLKYIEKRLAIDSVLNSDYKYLIKNVVQKYDTPRLLAEKQEIIDSLESDKKSSTLLNIIMIVISVLLLTFLVHNYLKRRNYKKKFNELYNSTAPHKTGSRLESLDNNKYDDIGISEEIIRDILNQLEEFEQSFGFLESNITTGTLSKSFNTNSKYLSKVVNRYKEKSFSAYINDLRIEYSVEKLKNDKKFMHYTMTAIAQEVGFNTSQAYSKSFYKKNGINPSYFIKQLQKQQN